MRIETSTILFEVLRFIKPKLINPATVELTSTDVAGRTFFQLDVKDTPDDKVIFRVVVPD